MFFLVEYKICIRNQIEQGALVFRGTETDTAIGFDDPEHRMMVATFYRY